MACGYAAARAPAVGDVTCLETAHGYFIMITRVEILEDGSSFLVPELNRPGILHRPVGKCHRGRQLDCERGYIQS